MLLIAAKIIDCTILWCFDFDVVLSIAPAIFGRLESGVNVAIDADDSAIVLGNLL